MAELAKKHISLPLRGMDLQETLFCGQTFSWEKLDDGGFAGVAGARAAKAWTQGGMLHLLPLNSGADEKEEIWFWENYFALDEDYAALQANFAKHDVMAQCVAACPGIRVLNQPFFDTLLSFIISQNNHIPRIFKITQKLRQNFGPQLAEGIWGFPLPQALAGKTEADLAVLQAGYRAKYLLDAAQKVAQNIIKEEELQTMSEEDARRSLCSILGVGPKVADCVLLFALGHKDVAPMDVWMKRALATHFNGEFPLCTYHNRGIAQQYIFHWARQNQGKKGEVDKN